ncbi:ABC transporter substrate-binding protein [Anaerohalosphaeraceae bacterium U12dextr]
MRQTKAYLIFCGILAAVWGCQKRKSSAEGEMVICRPMISKVQTLDPTNTRDIYSAMVVSQICEQLYVYHYLKRPYQLIPLLAESMPDISDDGKTYTIRIKQGVRFQDDPCFPDGKGRELKASDFVYAFKRLANARYASQNWSIFDDRIVGLNEFRDYSKGFKKEWDVDYSRPVEGVQALDDYTLQLKLTRPWPQILELALNDYCTSPVPFEAVQYYGVDIVSHPVGTGPYRLKTWQRSSYIELEKNPNWRGELYPSEGEPEDEENGLLADAGKPVPFADRIIFRIIEEDQPNWLLFMRGRLDVMYIPKDHFDKVMMPDKKRLSSFMQDQQIQLTIFNDPSTFWVGFNMKDPILGPNLPLRKAISRAIDRQKYIDILFNGRVQVAHGLVSPGLNSYDPNIADYGYSKFDLNEARALLKEAETIHGGPIPKLVLAMPGTDTLPKQMGQLLQRMLEQAGIQIQVDYMDFPTYMEKQNKGQCQMFISGVSASCPDAMDFLEMFASKYFAPGSNKFFYSNPEFDALYEQVAVMQDSPERLALYRKLEHMILKDYPAAFMTHRITFYLGHDWYKNFKPFVFGYGVLKYHRVDVEQRDRFFNRIHSSKQEGQ